MMAGTRTGRLAIAIVSCACLAPPFNAQAQTATYPRDIIAKDGTITLYQPQVDTLEGNQLSGRAAFAFKTPGQSEPQFGALWFTAVLDIDRSARIYKAHDVDVQRVRFPDLTEEKTQAWITSITKDVNAGELSGSLDSLLTALDTRKNEDKTAADIKNDPPDILITKQDAVLVPLDGEPVLRAVEKTNLQRVANTPFLMLQDSSSKRFYLNAGTLWYSAMKIEGPWAPDAKVPPQARALVSAEALREAGVKDADSKPVQVIVTRKPSELISFAGEPSFVPFTGNNLLYASNTESDVFLDVKAQTYYTLLSGRWYRSKSLANTGWSFVSSDALPEAFKNIPPNSPKGEARASIAGTDEAEEAILDASIPQTAAVKVGPAPDVSVNYDGKPQFQAVNGTDMQYAVNTSDPIFKEGTMYYACKDGVWYTAADPNGPWSVSSSTPNGIDKLPPSNPHYNTKYVYIYQTTPQIVYVGYTPAYMGTYIWGPTVIYGTGWYYRPWIGPAYYYPYSWTWGFHVRYNPWSGGWGFGLAYSTGGFGFSFAWGSGWYGGPYWGGPPGWWGPGGYWHGYNNGYANGYWRGRLDARYRDRPYLRPAPYNRYRNNAIHMRPVNTLPAGRFPNGNNIYGRPGVSKRISYAANRPAARPSVRPSNKPDNVFADGRGNVFRKDNKAGWQEYGAGKWKGADNSAVSRPAQPGRISSQPQLPKRPALPSNRPAPSIPGRGSIQGDAAGRIRGQARTQQMPKVMRPGGAGSISPARTLPKMPAKSRTAPIK